MSLANKWRPKIFNDVVGQKYVLLAIKNSLNSGFIHHAWLFSGIRGIGKTTTARLLSKSLNCEMGISFIPCNICDNCKDIDNGHFVDLLEIDAASKTKVEDMRDLLDSTQYLPLKGRFKIYLIDEVHMLSKHSFNALLKTLEEPPEHIKFILVTTDFSKIPLTIISRCIQFNLKSINKFEIIEKLKYILLKEKITINLLSLDLLANYSYGCMRDAISLTEQALLIGNGRILPNIIIKMLGILDKKYYFSLIKCLVFRKIKKMLLLLNKISNYDIDWDVLLIELLILLNKIVLMKYLPDINNNCSVLEIKFFKEISLFVTIEMIQYFYKTLLIGRKELFLSPTYKIGIEMILMKAILYVSIK
ncbi:DNA polymerase III subunit gamma/tau [Candidatus Purcelliella pentastirinorum]|uniref:DNA polymerase III subunit gamma/tau n=1 Tax=Candidatus Purcelliella pentastirinorum TaxID=472834 RepID=A0AAX3N9R5_9ENTR|nr:DNA polymerase III subunit gamma/tau [Candidatus Purcelliella pentastirinorum]WDI78734.1 DNA polymerase III subunit gamma/tau [Candidatus Purcelliella pentastirinorum]